MPAPTEPALPAAIQRWATADGARPVDTDMAAFLVRHMSAQVLRQLAT